MARTLTLVPLTLLACAAVLPSIREMTPPLHSLTLSNLRDTYHEMHNGHPHEALDLMAARGTPVLAVVPGTIRKLFLSKPGGNTIYQFDERAEYCYYYAHLDRYAPNLREGRHVARGEIIGFVGSTGNADPHAPHLHFAVFELGPEKQWWKGRPLDPYAALQEAVRRAEGTR